MKPLLSIIIPVAPNRCDRLAAILSRLNLNAAIFPDHTFEIIVADGGATDNTKELCETMMQYMPLKYVYLPIGRFINAAYPRNVMLRMCEGSVISMIDIDHWPSENIVYGMLSPFIEDSEFRMKFGSEYKKIKDCEKELNGRVYFNKNNECYQNIINRGYVIDSSKSSFCQAPNDETFADTINRPLLNPINFEKKILGLYDHFKIPKPGVNGTLWIWSLRRQDVLDLNGYDEQYCRQFAYVREDDDWRERLLAKGLRFWDGQNNNFCAIHLWHKAAQRNQDINRLNRELFDKSCCPVRLVSRNIDFQWGKLLRDSFSIIKDEVRNTQEHEEWVANNVSDMPSYQLFSEWSSLDEYMSALEDYASVGKK